MRRLLTLFATAALLAGARVAEAQDATASAADALFQSGKSAMDRGEYPLACERFRESFHLQPAAGTLLNVGACEEMRGHYALALQCFRDSLALLGAGDFRRPYAEEHLAALRPRVSSARLSVEGQPPAALQLAQDDVALSAASLGTEFFVDPGDHVYAASAPGFETQRVTVRLAQGEQRDIVFQLRPSPRSASALVPAAPLASRGGGSTLGPWILVGSGGALAALGGIFGVVVIGASTQVHNHCDATGCDDTGVSAARRGRPYAVLSPVFLGAGIALAGAGAAWLVFFRSSHVQASVAALQDNVSASLRGAF